MRGNKGEKGKETKMERMEFPRVRDKNGHDQNTPDGQLGSGKGRDFYGEPSMNRIHIHILFKSCIVLRQIVSKAVINISI